MTITALGIAFISTIIFYTGMAIARRIRNLWIALLIRVGSFFFGLVVAGITAALFDAPLLVAELAGEYYVYLVLAGALVYKLLVVKFIPLPKAAEAATEQSQQPRGTSD